MGKIGYNGKCYQVLKIGDSGNCYEEGKTGDSRKDYEVRENIFAADTLISHEMQGVPKFVLHLFHYF